MVPVDTERQLNHPAQRWVLVVATKDQPDYFAIAFGDDHAGRARRFGRSEGRHQKRRAGDRIQRRDEQEIFLLPQSSLQLDDPGGILGDRHSEYIPSVGRIAGVQLVSCRIRSHPDNSALKFSDQGRYPLKSGSR